MILKQISNYIRERGQAPLRDLALHFRIAEPVLRDMLQRLERKGQIRRLPEASRCQPDA